MTRPARPTRATGRRSIRAALVAASALTVITFSGCAASAPADPNNTPDAAPETSLVRIAMPDLDPVPDPAPPLTEAESKAARLADADAQWEALLRTYPDAVRPADPFEDYMTEANRIDVTRACYEAAGLPVDEAHDAADPDGPVTGIGTYTSNETEAIALWTCSAAQPTKRTAADPTDAELNWIYDYLTRYSAPCLEANGIDVPAPAPREEWVSRWPEYVWFPSTGSSQLEPTLEADLQALCLNADEKMAELRAAQG